MADPRPIYLPLTRRNRRLGGSSQLWIAEDGSHLMLVRTSWYVQTYSRFRLRDIQALIVHGHDLSLPAHIGAIMMTLVAMALSIQNVATPFAKGFFALLFSTVLAMLTVNLARGRRASVTIVTSATRMVLPAITRLKRAEEFAARLTPSIQAAQADLPILSAEHGSHASPREMAAPQLPDERPPIAIAAVLYGSVLFEGILSLVSLNRSVPAAFANLSWTLALAGAALGIYAAVAGHRALGARVLALVTGVASLTDFAMSGAAAFSLARGKNPPLPPGLPEHLKGLPMWFIEYARIASPILIALGVAGVAWTAYRAASKEPEKP